MEITVQANSSELTLGPVLFNWEPEAWRDFYFRIADEAPVSSVYLGEVICFKRAPLFEPYLDAVAARLRTAGKTVVRSTLAEVMSKQERKLVDDVCAEETAPVEANDGSALLRLRGRPHHAGPFVNVYNERTVAVLAGGGACNVCLPSEMPASAIAVLCAEAAKLGVTVELQVFGRLPLALSARCYHARAHGRTKDTCQFICNVDSDGMPLRTLENQPFLTVNGVQTMSHDYLNLIGELADLQDMGVTRFRL
jgi:O2-independent ubiquinone biosynthesis protein UbiV